MTTKKCKSCQQDKPITLFYSCPANNDGLMGKCIDCKNEQSRRTYLAKTTYYQQKHKEWNLANRAWYNKRDKDPAFRAKKRIRDSKRAKIRRLTDPQYKIKKNLRTRVYHVVTAQSAKKSGKFIDLLGCSGERLKAHLEKRFTSGMSWENYGFGNGKWHIDHIRPCDSFDLTQESEQRLCFHYSNLQPLWQAENIRKGNKFTDSSSE